MAKERIHGYLPDEKPPVGKLLLYALQQVIVMFPATITVALITGFHVSTTIFASGLATLCFVLITGRRIPLYYGSSFAYLSAVIGLMSSETVTNALSADEIAQLNGFLNGEAGFFAMPTAAIRYAQVGIVMSGLAIAAGLLVKFVASRQLKNPSAHHYRPCRNDYRSDPCRQRWQTPLPTPTQPAYSASNWVWSYPGHTAFHNFVFPLLKGFLDSFRFCSSCNRLPCRGYTLRLAAQITICSASSPQTLLSPSGPQALRNPEFAPRFQQQQDSFGFHRSNHAHSNCNNPRIHSTYVSA